MLFPLAFDEVHAVDDKAYQNLKWMSEFPHYYDATRAHARARGMPPGLLAGACCDYTAYSSPI